MIENLKLRLDLHTFPSAKPSFQDWLFGFSKAQQCLPIPFKLLCYFQKCTFFTQTSIIINSFSWRKFYFVYNPGSHCNCCPLPCLPGDIFDIEKFEKFRGMIKYFFLLQSFRLLFKIIEISLIEDHVSIEVKIAEFSKSLFCICIQNTNCSFSPSLLV